MSNKQIYNNLTNQYNHEFIKDNDKKINENNICIKNKDENYERFDSSLYLDKNEENNKENINILENNFSYKNNSIYNYVNNNNDLINIDIKIKNNNIYNKNKKEEDPKIAKELKKNNIFDNEELEENDGKENIIDDEDEETNRNYEYLIKFGDKKEKYDEKEIKNNKDIENNEIEVKKMSIKLLNKYIEGINDENKNQIKNNNLNSLNNEEKNDIINITDNNEIKNKEKNKKQSEKNFIEEEEEEKTYTQKYKNKLNSNKNKKNLNQKNRNVKNKNISLTPNNNKQNKNISKSRNINLNIDLYETPIKIKNEDNNYQYIDNTKNKNYEFLSEYKGNLNLNNINKREKLLLDSCSTEDYNIKSYADIIKKKKDYNNITLEKINKKIYNVINKYSLGQKLSIINIVQCLFDLNIIKELIKKNEVIDLNIEKFKYIILNIKGKEQQKLEELEFLEQLWIRINPSFEDYIKKDLFFKLLKILFSINNDSKISNLSTLIENLLIKNNININSNNNNSFLSPLTERKYEINDIWSIQKLIKNFLKLKNTIKYHNNMYKNNKIELYNNKNHKKYLPNQTEIKNEKGSRNLGIENNLFITPKKQLNRTADYNDNSTLINKRKINPVFERLYNRRKKYKGNKSSRNSKNKKFDFDFTPIFIANSNQMNKSFTNYSKEKKPKGYYDYILRNRSFINQKENKKKLIDDKIYGKNYEKIQKQKIEPFNITDLKEDRINTRNNKIKEKYIYNKNIFDKIYITIEIKIPNGELKPLKIYKNDNNIIELVDEFCEKYEIVNEKKRNFIISKVMKYKNEFFDKIITEENNNFNINKDL